MLYTVYRFQNVNIIYYLIFTDLHRMKRPPRVVVVLLFSSSFQGFGGGGGGGGGGPLDTEGDHKKLASRYGECGVQTESRQAKRQAAKVYIKDGGGGGGGPFPI